jgi:hypothetical protein
MQQTLRCLEFSLRTWKFKAIKYKISLLNGSALGPISSPLPSFSPLPTRGSDDIMQQPGVLEYLYAVDKEIKDKLLIFRPTPKKVRQLIEECSPYLQKAVTPMKNLRVVAKKLNMSGNKNKVAWKATPEGAKYQGMSAIKETVHVSIYTNMFIM